MKKHLLVITLLLLTGSTLAQEIIKGVIKDDNGETLPGSTVFIAT